MERDGTFLPSPMDDSSSPTTIYFCSICDKPFTNGRDFSYSCDLAPLILTFYIATSRNRHIRYCGRHTRNRPRSCRACNTAKTKCSFEVPCVRCKKRGIECVYDESVAAGRRMLPRSATGAHMVRIEPYKSPSSSLAFEALHGDDGILPNGGFNFADDAGGVDAQLQFFNDDERQPIELIAQRSPLKEILTFDELFAFEDDTLGQQQSSADVLLASHNNLDQKYASWCGWMRGNISLAVVTENPVMSNSNLLAVLPIERPHAQHNADLIIQSLRSLPTMMLRRETLPWFIHPHSQLLSKSAGATLPEALSNCMSIAQIFTSRTSDTKSFLRQTIGAEYRRFNSEVQLPANAIVFSTLTVKRCTTCPNLNSLPQCKLA